MTASTPARPKPRQHPRPPMPGQLVIGQRELAYILGRTVDWVHRNIDEQILQGFPAPLPGPGHRRWSLAAVRRWAGVEAKETAPAQTIDYGAILDQRTEKIAAGKDRAA